MLLYEIEEHYIINYESTPMIYYTKLLSLYRNFKIKAKTEYMICNDKLIGYNIF